jgi:REP element-mobilizing transposase RayT
VARKLRVQYPGAIYHVMNRGDHREAVFHDTHDPELFLATLYEACSKTDSQIHSFCHMSNHFHLIVETPRMGYSTGQFGRT